MNRSGTRAIPLMSIEPKPNRFQFRLSYLLYVLTVFAVAFAVIRRVVATHFLWLETSIELVLVGALIVYFVIRVPLLFRRWRRGSRQVASQRQQLEEFAMELKKKREEAG